MCTKKSQTLKKVIFQVGIKVTSENVRIHWEWFTLNFGNFLRILDPQPKYTILIKKRVLESREQSYGGTKLESNEKKLENKVTEKLSLERKVEIREESCGETKLECNE